MKLFDSSFYIIFNAKKREELSFRSRVPPESSRFFYCEDLVEGIRKKLSNYHIVIGPHYVCKIFYLNRCLKVGENYVGIFRYIDS